ncbi:glycosyltransferase [Flavobacterium sp.]|uniref:glycosyltransferase family protein n=1 Tax=Flavobacterium sp. TaxID=239 RepID=UPI0039E6FB2F
MNILLIGEYSRLHNSLKEGLQALGHQVVLFGFNDGFKDYPVDFALYKQWDSGILKKIKLGFLKLTGFDLSSYWTYRQFLRYKKELQGFDVVQLINENSFYCDPKHERKILDFIFKNNPKTFLLSCGDDYSNVTYNFAHPEQKSVVQPYLMGKIKDKAFINVLKFRLPGFKQLHDFIYRNIAGVIATDFDYVPALKGNQKFLGLVPNPVNVTKFDFESLPLDKIVLFLGINTENYYKKGSDYFEQALEIIRQKYPEKVEIIVARSVPYAQYIQLYNRAHIVLDQVFSLDQGYNALEAMARGKVVFTGAGEDFTAHYGLTQRVNIHVVPDVDSIVESLSELIENPAEITAIGKRARQFIENEHDYIQIAQQYLNTWR